MRDTEKSPASTGAGFGRTALWVWALCLLALGSCGGSTASHPPEVWQCPMHPQVTAAKKEACPICKMDLVKVAAPTAAETWTCPMHPKVTSDHKGSCPICHMDLVKVDKAPSKQTVAGYATVTLDDRQRQLIGVRTEVVARKSITRTLRAYGNVSHDTELYGAQQEYLSAWRFAVESRKNGEQAGPASALLSAARKKLVILGYTETQLANLERSGVSDESLIVAHGSRVWVDAQVYENDLPYVHPGQSVQIRLPSHAGHAFTGVIQSMGTRVNPETRSVTARILGEHGAGVVVHDSYVQVLFTVPLGEVLAIPESAVLDSGERVLAFVALDGGVFEPRDILLGRRGEGQVEVLRGVAEGEKVVVKANFLLDSESQLKAALDNMAPGKGAP